VDHRCDLVRDLVGDLVAGSFGAAVDGEDHWRPCRFNRCADRIDVFRKCDSRPIGVDRHETGKLHRSDVMPGGF
jgi:hypothetical protein